MRLCRQSGAIRQTVTKLLRTIARETERLAEERDMSHLATGTNLTFAIEVEHRTGNIQQGSTAGTLHEGLGIPPDKIHHDGWAQQPHFTERHAARGTTLLCELGYTARIKGIVA